MAMHDEAGGPVALEPEAMYEKLLLATVPPSNSRVPEPPPPPEPAVTANVTVTTICTPIDGVTVTWLVYVVTFNPTALAVTFTVAVPLPATELLNAFVVSHVSPPGVESEKLIVDAVRF